MKTVLRILFLIPSLLAAQTGSGELVDIKELIPDIIVDLKYNTTDNFATRISGSPQKLYTTDICMVARSVAERLIVVQDSLRKLDLGLKIFDGYRPRAVQYLMWELVPNPTYVADPNNGSNHNRGAAVDVTIVDRSTGQEIPMPTAFDFFGPEAAHGYQGLDPQVIQNREFLRTMMTAVGGFTEYVAEWWHYHYVRLLPHLFLIFSSSSMKTQRITTLCILFLICAAASVAQVEFVVNSTLDSTQRDPHIARDAQGNYVVVWNSVDSVSQGDIVLRFFNAADQAMGVETLVSDTTSGNQVQPAVAMNARGDLVVAWASFSDSASLYDIKGRRFRNGFPLGGEFLVNTTTIHTQMRPAVAINDSGNFIIAWDSWHQDGSDRGVFAQQYDSSGTMVGTEFRLNTTTAYSQMRPAVRVLPSGRFVAIWQSWDQDLAAPEGYGIVGRIFEGNGTPTGNEFAVNTYSNDYQWFGDLTVLDDGSFVVVWCSWEQDGDDGGIYGQRFDPTGAKKGAEFLINTATTQYQWLPKVRKLSGKGFAVAWSSWKQDGSREGVFAQLFDSTGRKTSFETQVNTTTTGFQWEPDFVTFGADELLVVWSSWGQTDHDYEVIARRLTPVRPQGILSQSSTNHSAGRSTSVVKVHVVDSTALTGKLYEFGFDSVGTHLAAHLVNLSTGDTAVGNFLLDRAEGFSYMTPVVEGIAVELRPDFRLLLAPERSYVVNTSGTNLMFSVGLPTAGTPLLAPIDIALSWGSMAQSPDGSYVSPLDTALGTSGIRNVIVPFRAWNLTDNQRADLLVLESPASTNQRFDPGEKIIVLTPAPYRTSPINTHAQISTSLPAGAFVPPAPGDTNVIMTVRPLNNEDRYQFSAARSMVVHASDRSSFSKFEFELRQNYPNPFNPTTTFVFTLPSGGVVDLSVYNLLGQRMATLLHEQRTEGRHRVLWDASRFPSGVYFYVLRMKEQSLTRKMVLVK